MPSRTTKHPGDMPITYFDLDQPVARGHSLPAGRCPWSGLTAPRHVHPQPAHRSVWCRAGRSDRGWSIVDMGGRVRHARGIRWLADLTGYEALAVDATVTLTVTSGLRGFLVDGAVPNETATVRFGIDAEPKPAAATSEV